MSLCDKFITGAIKRDCNYPMSKGFTREGYLIRRSDIDFASLEVGRNFINALPLKSGATAIKIIQDNNAFTGSTSSVVVGTYANSVTNNIVFLVPEKTAMAYNRVDAILSGQEFVVVLENKEGVRSASLESGNDVYTPFQVFGLSQGLVVSAGEVDYYSDDTLGGWLITLTETGANTSGYFLDAGGYEATKEMLEGMIIQAPDNA